MKRRDAILVGVGFFLGMHLSFGGSSGQDMVRPSLQGRLQPDTNCTLTVQQVSHTGETETQIYTLKVADEKACKKTAKRHKTNFAPQSVKNKTVKMKWGGG